MGPLFLILRRSFHALVVILALSVLTATGSKAAQGEAEALPTPAAEAAKIATPSVTTPAATSATPAPTEDRGLTEARKRNEQAQAVYYEKLANKLDQRSEGGQTGYLVLWVALISLLGALIASRVAYLSFLYNYQNQLRTNSDTRFFEALKRFGDKDSAAMRTSAAGMLAVMGKIKLPKLDKGKPAFFGQRSNADAMEQPYLSTALDQLLAGHMLENSPVVLASTKEAILELYPSDREATVKKLEAANLKAQEDLAMTLAGFFSLRGATRADAIDEDLWSNAAALTGFRSVLLKELKDRFDKNLPPSSTGSMVRALPQRFTRLFEDVRASREIMPAGEGVILNDRVVGDLRAAAERLRTNDELLKRVLSDGARRHELAPQILLLEGPSGLETAQGRTK
jgi:hypothetical protein